VSGDGGAISDSWVEGVAVLPTSGVGVVHVLDVGLAAGVVRKSRALVGCCCE
jgi:hypothetical protein